MITDNCTAYEEVATIFSVRKENLRLILLRTFPSLHSLFELNEGR